MNNHRRPLRAFLAAPSARFLFGAALFLLVLFVDAGHPRHSITTTSSKSTSITSRVRSIFALDFKYPSLKKHVGGASMLLAPTREIPRGGQRVEEGHETKNADSTRPAPVTSTPSVIVKEWMSQWASIGMGLIFAWNSGFMNGCALSGAITVDGSSQAVAAVTASWTNSALGLASRTTSTSTSAVTAKIVFLSTIVASFIFGSFIAGFMMEPTTTTTSTTPYVLPKKAYSGPLTIAAGLVLFATKLLQDIGKVKMGFYLLAMANGINNSVTSVSTIHYNYWYWSWLVLHARSRWYFRRYRSPILPLLTRCCCCCCRPWREIYAEPHILLEFPRISVPLSVKSFVETRPMHSNWKSLLVWWLHSGWAGMQAMAFQRPMELPSYVFQLQSTYSLRLAMTRCYSCCWERTPRASLNKLPLRTYGSFPPRYYYHRSRIWLV